LLFLIPLLIGLSRLGGFERTATLGDDIVDAFVAIAVGATISIVLLTVLGIVTSSTPLPDAVGKTALQTFPASLGAMLARSQLGTRSEEPEKARKSSYSATLLIMTAGALFLGLNVAPTEEVVLLGYKMGLWRLLAVVLLSLAVMHAFVYSVSFRGAPETLPGATFWSLFARYTVVGYAIVLIVAWYLLWTFGRTESTGIGEVISACIVLGLPGAIGAASSRLVL
jgi:putative integral membrane protein (TIGR02587 family)